MRRLTVSSAVLTVLVTLPLLAACAGDAPAAGPPIDARATSGWQPGPALNTARAEIAAAALDGRIHALGGEAFGPNRTFAEHEVYTPEEDAWESAPPPTARHGLAAAGLDGRVYLIGSGSTAGLSVSDLTEIYAGE